MSPRELCHRPEDEKLDTVTRGSPACYASSLCFFGALWGPGQGHQGVFRSAFELLQLETTLPSKVVESAKSWKVRIATWTAYNYFLTAIAMLP